MKNLKMLTVIGAAGLALAGGTVAGAASQGTPDVNEPAAETPLSVDARQARSLAEYSASQKAEPVAVGSVTTDLATITLTRVAHDGKVSSLCASVRKSSGGGTQGCREGSALTEPLVGVSRDAQGALVVTGIAPGADGTARIVGSDGTTAVAGSQTKVTARAGTLQGYQPVAVRIQGENDIALSYTDPTTGTKKLMPLAGTVKALDAK